ncbi:MAG: DNA adenine methylase [Verrucomicrobia bacterium]|nr:DNA adenine methylase [Verrucomicrobiota bacterium]
MKVPHPIPHQGSKRNLAPAILGYFTERVGTLIEPFAGSAALDHPEETLHERDSKHETAGS